jgi:formate/nitrite transporter
MNSPKEIAQNYIAIGVAKTENPAIKTLVLGMLAGMFVALASAGATIVQATLANTPLASVGRLLSGTVFPTGLVMVLIAGSELFTGNCLLIIPVLQRKIKIRAILKNWLLVYIGNFIGGVLVALLSVYGGVYSLFGNTASISAISTAVSKVTLTFDAALLRGILCNFVVCIAVWMSFAAKDIVGKVAALFLPIMLFVLSGYEHSIANMCFIPTGLFAKSNANYLAAYTSQYPVTNLEALTWGTMFSKNLIPVTLGNIIGGTGLVGIVYWFAYLHEPSKGAHGKTAGKK